MDVANTAIGAAANKLYNVHMAEAYGPMRLKLFEVGLPLDTYERLLALKTEYHRVLAAREAHDDAWQGEAIDPQLDAKSAHRWIGILHSSARAYASDGHADADKILRKLGVGTSPSDNPRQAYLSVGKLLTALDLLGPTALTLPANFIADGEALIELIPKDESEREGELSARQMATRRLVELEAALEKIFNQVAARARLLESITGEPVPGVDFGDLRAAAADNSGGDSTPTAPNGDEPEP